MSREYPAAWIPESNPITLAALGKLGEELGDATAIVARCMIQGSAENDPDTGTPNLEALRDEIADVMAAANVLIDHLQLDKAAIDERIRRKEQHLRTWHRLIDNMKPAS